jgi:uncharacterized protein YjiS (DUF1127 family)
MAMTMLTHIPHAATPGARRFALVLARVRRGVDCWLAALIMRYERQAARTMLGHLSDRDLKDIGICRSNLDYALRRSTRRD